MSVGNAAVSGEAKVAGLDLATQSLPFETEALRQTLFEFLETLIDPLGDGHVSKLGSCQCGVYAFYDYDREPIYVGQTNEMLRVRIRRHLTNRRTDAVAMNVLDPFEVCYIEVWPLPQFEGRKKADPEVKGSLNALEYAIFSKCIEESAFKAILNEKEPPQPSVKIEIPPSYSGKLVTEEISRLRDHPDLRIARRAAVMARLAQIISERKAPSGLRRTLLTQAKRLQWLAERRYQHAVEPIDED